MKHFLTFACLVCALLVSNTVHSDDDPVNRFEVTKNGTVCLLATFAARFNVTYNTTGNYPKAVATFAIPADATVNQNASECRDETAKLVIDFFTGYNLTVTFGVNGDDCTIDTLSLGYTFDKNFPDAETKNETNLSIEYLNTTLAPYGDSYQCDSMISRDLSDFSLTTRELQLQPFEVKDGNYSEATLCPEDLPIPTPPPPPPVGTWNVSKDDKVCLLADFGMDFTIPYTMKTTPPTMGNATFYLPASAVVDTNNSTCGSNKSKLVLNFDTDSDKSFNLTLKFEKGKDEFYANEVILDYFLDNALFPYAADEGAKKNASTSKKLFLTSNGKSYSCHAEQEYALGNGSMMTIEVQLQPFDVNEHFSDPQPCPADVSVTTPAPTTPMPTLGPEVPTPGNWTVKNNDNVTCMLVDMAVEFTIVYVKTDKSNSTVKHNLNPDGSNADSSVCSKNTSTFILEFHDDWVMTLVFNKTKNNKYTMNYFELNYTLSKALFPDAADPDKPVSRFSNDADFSATVGNSYQCDASTMYKIDPSLNVTMRKVHIQPFAADVKDQGFGAAEDCKADENISNIVPIAVGCALAGLVIIVLIAYLIGRRRSQAKGYQSV